jgi:hypothetical protein
MSHPGHNSQTWIFAAEKRVLEDLAVRLAEKAGNDGFNIKFVQVLGTDNLQPDNPPIPNSLMAATIVTDVSRKSDMFCEEQRKQLSGYSSWEEMEGGEDTGVKTWYCQPKWKPSFRV